MTQNSDPFRRLESSEKFGIKLGLDQIRTLLNELGNPQDSFSSILIAGTNGKGSVSAMLDAIFLAHEFQTGLYTSPHLVDVRERIRVSGEMISTLEFEESLTVVFSAVDRLISSSQLENLPTHFEILTAAAFYHFRKAGIRYAIVEVGMGGRFDATSVLNQFLSIITTIDLDHEQYLGKSLAEIAFEKSGIFKPAVPIVTGILPAEAQSVVESNAAEKGCLIVQTKSSNLRNLRLEDGFPVFEYEPWQETIRVHLRGRHQAANAAVALLASDVLREGGVSLNRQKIVRAFASVEWPGRLQILSRDPLVLADSAHNPMGVQTLVSFLEDMNWNRVVILFTAMQDKNFPLMLQLISKKAENIFLTRVPPENRCAEMDELVSAAKKAGIRAEAQEDPEVAFEKAKEAASRSKIPLVIFGSMYLVGRILAKVGLS